MYGDKLAYCPLTGQFCFGHRPQDRKLAVVCSNKFNTYCVRSKYNRSVFNRFGVNSGDSQVNHFFFSERVRQWKGFLEISRLHFKIFKIFFFSLLHKISEIDF